MSEAATRTQGPARRIARDAVAIAGLASEWISLRLGDRRDRAAEAPCRRAIGVRWGATWKAAAVGAVAALPPGAMFGVAASAVEAGLLAHIEADASARLLAIANVSDASSRERPGPVAFRAGAQQAVRVVAEHAARSVAAVTFKEIGLALPRAGARAVLGAAAPFVGMAWGATWNAVEMHRRLDAPVRTVRALAPVVLVSRRAYAPFQISALGPATWSRGAVASV